MIHYITGQQDHQTHHSKKLTLHTTDYSRHSSVPPAHVLRHYLISEHSNVLPHPLKFTTQHYPMI